MFEPVTVPGQGEDPSRDILTAEIERWVTSEPMLALVRQFGGEDHLADALAGKLAYLDDFTTRAWDFRKTQERNQVDADAITGDDERLVLDAADALGLVRPVAPRYDYYDHVVVLGGLVRANIWRPAYAAYLLSHGVTASEVTAICGYRDLARNDKEPDKDEYELLKVFGLPPRDHEWEVVEDGLRRAFSLPELTVERESDTTATGSDRFRVASAKAGDLRVSLVAAPALEPGRRANTADGYRYWAEQVAHVAPGSRVLAVTTCIYVPYQHAVAIRLLGLPFGCGIDTVGIDTAVIGDSLSPQLFRGVSYLLEIRSALRAYRQLAADLGVESGARSR